MPVGSGLNLPRANDLGAVNRALDELRGRLGPVLQVPILDGVLLEDVAIGTTDTRVPHGLGRAFRGWAVVDQDADATVWRSGIDHVAEHLTLQASAPVNVSLWVF